MQLIVEDPSLVRVLSTHSEQLPRPAIPHQTTTISYHATTNKAIAASEMHHSTSTELPRALPSVSHSNARSCHLPEQQNPLALYLQDLHNKCQLMIPPPPRSLVSYTAATSQATLTPVYLSTCITDSIHNTPAPHSRDSPQPTITELQTVPESPPLPGPPCATSAGIPLLSQSLQSQCEDREQLVQESDDEIDMPAVPTTPLYSQLLSSSHSPDFYETEHKQTDLHLTSLPSRDAEMIPHSFESLPVLLGPYPEAEEQEPPQKKARLCSDTHSNTTGHDVTEIVTEKPAPTHPWLTSHGARGDVDNSTVTSERGEVEEEEGEELSTERADDGSSTLDQAVPCESAREHALVVNLVPCNRHWGRGPNEGGGGQGPGERGGGYGGQECVLSSQRETDSQTVVCEDQQTAVCKDQQTAVCEDQQTAVCEDQQTAVCEDQQTAVCEDQQTAVWEDQQTAVCEDQQTAVCEDQQTAVCEDQQTAVCEDQQTAVCEDQQTVICEDQQTAVCEVKVDQQVVPCGPDDAAEEDSLSHSVPMTSIYEEQQGKLSTHVEVDHNTPPPPWLHHHPHYYQLSRPATTTTCCGYSSRGKNTLSCG